ncbi:MAG: hypothetical protein NPMRTH1_1000004 [Nitrosopumilales archaeon]|nr:MAG: hypothetical protein NPMRTH1_1000004 [Nitrosopumilales archaeon]
MDQMVLVDKKILSGGLAMVVIGITISLYLNSVVPIGTSGMSEEETFDLLTKQQENQDVSTLAGILMGIGFLLVLISFGARRKRKGGKKIVEKKPA